MKEWKRKREEKGDGGGEGRQRDVGRVGGGVGGG